MLDEPTNHLDVGSVKWLEDLLLEQKGVAYLIISHDSGFLDNVTMDIIRKLGYYTGSLKPLVDQVPSAKSYYTPAATSIRFSFPASGSSIRVRPKTRTILKLTNCTFTLPRPRQAEPHRCVVRLEFVVEGGNYWAEWGGEEYVDQVVDGEMIPQECIIHEHPALRAATSLNTPRTTSVRLHPSNPTNPIALAREQYFEKTPVTYIQWRYQSQYDKEVLEKVTHVMTAEEQELMVQNWVGKTGERRNIEDILGRQKPKTSYQYEIKWRGLDHEFNV